MLNPDATHTTPTVRPVTADRAGGFSAHLPLVPPLLLAVMVAAAGCWMYVRAAHRFDLYGGGAFDLGIYQQAVWLIAHGDRPFDTIRGLHIMGDHWTPILYLLAPLTYVFTGPTFLVGFQSASLALGAIPLYRLALRQTRHPWLSLLLCASYLLHPSLVGLTLFDFHPVVMAVPLLIAAVDALDAGDERMFIAWSLLSLVTKEEVAAAAVLLGALAWIHGRRAAGVVVALGSVIWLVGSLKFMAFFAHTESTSYWSLYHSTLGQAHHGVLAVLGAIFRKLTGGSCAWYLPEMLLPTGLFALAAPEVLLVAGPGLLTNLLADRIYMQHVGYQYDSVPIALVYAAAAIGIGRILRGADGDSRTQTVGVVAALLIASAYVGVDRFAPPITIRFFNVCCAPGAAAARSKVLSAIPPDASIISDNLAVSHLYRRRQLYLFPNPLETACWGSSDLALEQQGGKGFSTAPPLNLQARLSASRIPYVLLDLGPDGHFPLGYLYPSRAVECLLCPSYGVVARGGGFVLLRRDASHWAGLKQLGVYCIPQTSQADLRRRLLHLWPAEAFKKPDDE